MGLRVRMPGAGPIPLKQLLREDFEANGSGWFSPGFHALVVHRCARALEGAPRVARQLLTPIVKIAEVCVRGVYGIELGSAQIGRRLAMPHAHGIVLNSYCVIGDDCMLRHNVTIGQGAHNRAGVPTIGDRVQFGPGAIVMGEVTVGDDVHIGPNAVVISDVPAGHRVLAPLPTLRAPRERHTGTPARSEALG